MDARVPRKPAVPDISCSFLKWGFGNALSRGNFIARLVAGLPQLPATTPAAKLSFPAMVTFPKPHFGNERTALLTGSEAQVSVAAGRGDSRAVLRGSL
jgi:hypothetical protein